MGNPGRTTPNTPMFKPRVHLFNLSPAKGSTHNRHRFGRGDGSGRGGTSGRGHKGQNSRSGNGKPKAGFEGGQTSIARRFPKRGFINQAARTWAPLNLDRLQHWIDKGRLTSSPTEPITARELVLTGCVHNAHDGIKILADGADQLRSVVHIRTARASKTAVKAIEKLGGTIFCEYQNRLALRDTIQGRTDRESAGPTRREDIEWYTKWSNRGYLAPKSIATMPVVRERWKALSQELVRHEREKF